MENNDKKQESSSEESDASVAINRKIPIKSNIINQ